MGLIMFAHIPTDLNFLYKYGKPEKGLRKSVNKQLNIYQQFIQRYVLFYLQINPHAPYGMELDFQAFFKDKLTQKEITQLSNILADIAFIFARKQGGGYGSRRFSI